MNKKITADIIITPEGEMNVITRDGTFADGLKGLALFVEGLETNGLKITQGPKFEQHRHDQEEAHHHHHWEVKDHG